MTVLCSGLWVPLAACSTCVADRKKPPVKKPLQPRDERASAANPRAVHLRGITILANQREARLTRTRRQRRMETEVRWTEEKRHAAVQRIQAKSGAETRLERIYTTKKIRRISSVSCLRSFNITVINILSLLNVHNTRTWRDCI